LPLRCLRNAHEIKRHPEIETLLVTGDNRADAMKKVLGWLTVGGKVQRTGQKATPIIAEALYPLGITEHSVVHEGNKASSLADLGLCPIQCALTRVSLARIIYSPRTGLHSSSDQGGAICLLIKRSKSGLPVFANGISPSAWSWRCRL